jgi:hypothetical protein
MTTKAKRRVLTRDERREFSRLLGAVLDRVYDGTLDATGSAGVGVVRRMEGAKIALEAALNPVPSRKNTRRSR